MASFTEFAAEYRKKKKKGQTFTEFAEEQLGTTVPVVVPSSTPQKTVEKNVKSGFTSDIAPVKTTKSSKSTKKDDDERTWFKKGSGGVVNTILGTVADIGEDIGTGIIGMGEKAVDFLTMAGTAMGNAQMSQLSNDELAFSAVKNIGKDKKTKEKEAESIVKKYNTAQKDAKKGTTEFVKKDLYNEEAIAKKIITAPFQKATDIDVEASSVLGEKSDALLQSGGQLLATMGLQAMGVPWFLTTGATSFGAEAENALNQGATFEQATMSAAVSTGAEILTEKLSGGIKFGGKTLDDVLLKPLTEKISSKALKTLTNLGVDALGEGAEEVVSGVLSNLGSALYKEDDLTDILFSEEAVDEYIESFIGGAALGGFSSSVRAVANRNKVELSEDKLSEQAKTVFDKVVEEKIAEATKDGKALTEMEEAKIRQAVLDEISNGDIDTEKIESILDPENYEKYKKVADTSAAYEAKLNEGIEKMQQRRDELQKEYDELNELDLMTAKLGDHNRQNDIKDEMASLDEKIQQWNTELEEYKNDKTRSELETNLKTKLGQNVFELVKDTELGESYRRKQAFEADTSNYKNEKARQTVQNAIDSGLLRNSKADHDAVDFVAKVTSKIGLVAEFTTKEKITNDYIELKTQQIAELEKIPEAQRTREQIDKLAKMKNALEKVKSGKLKVNGNTKQGVITINLDSVKPVEFITGHELLHNLIKSKVYKNGDLHKAFKSYLGEEEYEKRLEKVKETYEGNEATPEEEFAANLVGEYIFNDYDFVMHLATTNHNMFRNFWDSIKHLYKMATAGSKEARDLERVKRNFEKAYKEVAKSGAKVEGTKNSLSDAQHTLSPEQEDYFKDSKVRDENGNLKVMYHGTSKGGHTVFDTFGESRFGLFGAGTYFTDNKDIAESYTEKGRGNNKQVYETYLNITNPIDMDAKADVDAWKKAFRDADYSDCVTNEDCFKAMKEVFIDEQYPQWEAKDTAMDVLQSMGYDGITHIGGGRVNADGTRHQVYIAFEPEQIKNIDNIAPTKDADIRYSLTETDNEYLSAVESGDTETAQRMVDEVAKKSGYTVKGFHATNADFTMFDINKTSDNNFHGKGIYFTNSTRDVENNYENYEGPDPWQKIEERAYELADEKYGFSYEDTLTGDADIIDKLNECYDEAIEEFKSTIHRVTAYLKFDNPLILKKGDNKKYDLSQYDGIIDEQVYENIGHAGMDENTVHYVVFNPRNIKSADAVTYDDNGNVIPLSQRFNAENNDIRYSLTEDSEGNKLTENQSKYFANTKAVDQNGNLLKVYHTTKNDFTVFDKARKGEATEDANTYLGFFFSDDAEYMQNFPEFENGKTESYYLDMKNPIDMTDISEEAFLDIVEVMGGDIDEAAEVYAQELADEQDRAKLRGDNRVSLTLGNLLNELTGEFYYDDFIRELKPNYDELMSKGYDGVINYMDELFGVKEYIVLDSNQAKLTSNKNPTADADVRYSLSSMANTFFDDPNMSAEEFENADYTETQGYKDYVEKCLNNYRQTRVDFNEKTARKSIKDSIDGIVRVAIAAKKAGYDIADDKYYYDEDNNKRHIRDSKNRLLFSSLEPNSDYLTSNDISTECDKRKNFADIYDAIVKREEAMGVPHGKRFFDNVDNYFYIHKVLADKGLTQPCRECYVESMRKNLAPMARKFLQLITETNVNNKANDQLYQTSGKNKGQLKSNNAKLRERVLEILSENEMSVDSLNIEKLSTAEGLAELKITAPYIYEAFNSFYGQSKPKMPRTATPFRFGELTALLTDSNGKINQTLVDKINATGGFRLQSYSDFQIQNYVDVLQVLFEAGTLGLSGHAYTKVPAFLQATEGTNLKRNISIFMYKDGTEWKIDKNDSFPYELEDIYDIVDADKSGNTSIIAVSQNDDMSAWIMANDNIGYGIPFHKSGLKMGTVRETDVKTDDGRIIKGYSGIKDHTKQQTEVWAKTTADHKAFTKVKKGINIYNKEVGWDFENKKNLSKTELIKKNLKAYINACERAGYLPKFRAYVMNNDGILNKTLQYAKELGFVSQNATIEDISFKYKGYTIPYGYYKFLGDFGMFTPDGKASPHKTLSLDNYDFDKAVEFFADSEKLRRNEILQQFANGEERAKYRNSNLNAGELADIVRQKRDEVVDSIVAPTKSSLSDDNGTSKGYATFYGRKIANRNIPLADIAPVKETVSKTEKVAPTVQSNAPTVNEEDYAPMTEAEANAMYEADKGYINSFTDADMPPEMDAPIYSSDTTSIDEKALNNIAKTVKDALSLSVAETKAIKDIVQKYSTSEYQSEADLFEEIKANFGEKSWSERNEEIANVKQVLRSYKINVSPTIKREITDYAQFRRRNFGKITFSKEGIPVDTAYMELSDAYPSLFPASITNATDQLLQMVEVANMEINETQTAELDDESIQEVTELIVDVVNTYKENELLKGAKAQGREFLKNANKYEEEMPKISNDFAPTKQYEAIEPRPDVLSDEEKQWAKNKMTRADKVDAEEKPRRRSELHQSIVDRLKGKFKEKGFDFDDVLNKAKNLSTIATVDNIPQRVMEKTFGYKQGQILADETVNKVAQNESEGIKWLNSFTDRKNGVLAQISKQYNIKPGSKKSAAAQMYAEGFYVNKNNEIIKYGDRELAIDFPDLKVQANIKGLARDPRIRQIYDDTLNAINESRSRNLYPEIPRLDNYFLHFRAMEDTFSQLGLPFNPNDIRAKDLPTDLNGVTADLKPGQPYFASAKHREGMRTSFDLLGGLERYLSSAKNQIYHIDDIQTLRALRNYIADTYGQAKGLESLDDLTDEEAQYRIEQVYSSHLSTFAKFLNEEANVLAGKTTLIDRGLEGVFGRKAFTFFDTLNKQVGSNMVGWNISSSLTNFLPVAQTFAKTNKFDFTKAFAQTVSSKVGSIFGKTDSFVENNPTIIRRKGAERFYRTPYQKIGDTGYVLMSAVDDISTELIVRTKYNELIRKGMDEQKASFEADKWVSRLMGDRSLGQQPQLYNSKMLGLVTKFQLEVRNQLDSQFYDTIQEAKVSNEEIENKLLKNAKTAAKVTSVFFQLAAVQHLYGMAFESIAGYNPAFDIIDVLIKALGFDDDEDDEDTVLDNLEEGFFALLEDLPYTSTFTGGRIPISSALPIKELIKGEDQYGNEKSRVETLKETAPYYVLPTGYGQIKKTAQGLGMFSDEHPVAGSYTDSGNLRFPVEKTPLNVLQAGVFGQYANKNARTYFDEDYAPLKEKQIKEYAEADMPIADYWKYREGLKDFDKQAEKAAYINGLDISKKQKDVLKSYLYDEEGYKKENPEKYAFLEREGIGYLGYKELDEDTQSAWSWAFKHQDEYEYYKENGVLPGDYSTYYIPMLDFKDEDDQAYQWSFDNPEKATVGKVFGDGVKEYRQYTGELNEIKADKDENGKTINGSAKEKKKAYIWSLPIDYGQKIILYRSLYDSKDDKAAYNQDIIDYLNSRDDITYDEMNTICEELGFTVNRETGYISW